MDLLEHLQREFGYDAWANGEVLAAIKADGAGLHAAQPPKLLAHILSAERLWLERLRQQPQSLPVWPNLTLDHCSAQMAELAGFWPGYFAQLSSAGLSQKVAYQNSQGEPWSSTVQDILAHVVIHSAYHRGQIAGLRRAAGGTPAYTDFIHAARQGLIK